MTSSFPLISSAAILVAVLHMIAPDHWLPITVISEAKGFSKVKKYGITASIGLLHGVLSSSIALALLYVGLVFLSKFIEYLTLAGILLLIVVGAYFFISGFLERGSNTIIGSTSISVSILPDFAIIPILLSASALNAYQIGVIVTLFILVGVASLISVVAAASYVTDLALKKVSPAYFDYAIGFTLLLTALYIYLEAS
ncbi:MAG: hypothetical protein QW100_00555 [Thermoplasmatales archaeon]